MKKVIFLIFIVAVILILNHGSRSMNRAGDRVYSNFLETCNPGSVKTHKSFTQYRVDGWDCVGPGSSGSGYKAEIWDHFFWLV